MLTKTSPITPNLRQLLIEIMATIQIDETKARFGGAGIEQVLAYMVEIGAAGYARISGLAFDRMITVLEAVRAMPGGAWPTDEDAAGVVLRLIEARRAAGRSK